jgi:hypothetical protein
VFVKGEVMNVELNKSNKGNYGWLDLQRMNLPFTTIDRTYRNNMTDRTFITSYNANSAERDYAPSLPAHLHPNVGDDQRRPIP